MRSRATARNVALVGAPGEPVKTPRTARSIARADIRDAGACAG
jgi:hypothetical protein